MVLEKQLLLHINLEKVIKPFPNNLESNILKWQIKQIKTQRGPPSKFTPGSDWERLTETHKTKEQNRKQTTKSSLSGFHKPQWTSQIFSVTPEFFLFFCLFVRGGKMFPMSQRECGSIEAQIRFANLHLNKQHISKQVVFWAYETNERSHVCQTNRISKSQYSLFKYSYWTVMTLAWFEINAFWHLVVEKLTMQKTSRPPVNRAALLSSQDRSHHHPKCSSEVF